MFENAEAFDQDIRGWATMDRATLSSFGMFLGATAWQDKYERTADDGYEFYDYDSDGLDDNGPPSAWTEKSNI